MFHKLMRVTRNSSTTEVTTLFQTSNGLDMQCELDHRRKLVAHTAKNNRNFIPISSCWTICFYLSQFETHDLLSNRCDLWSMPLGRMCPWAYSTLWNHCSCWPCTRRVSSSFSVRNYRCVRLTIPFCSSCAEECVLSTASNNRRQRHRRHTCRLAGGLVEHRGRAVLSASLVVQDIQLLCCVYVCITVFFVVCAHILPVAWSCYVAACAVLALSRCAQMYSAEVAQRLWAALVSNNPEVAVLRPITCVTGTRWFVHTAVFTSSSTPCPTPPPTITHDTDICIGPMSRRRMHFAQW
jgi:hypothetical protein